MVRYQLTPEQQQFYSENGYIIGLQPIYSAEEMKVLNQELNELAKLLLPDEKMLTIREWHVTSRWLYDVCTNPRILDYVEGILGPNFYMWGSQFFAKAPHTKDTVAWHQDSYYWPLHPHNSVTVWLAFTDVDVDNGAMQVIPRSHKAGLIKHKDISGDSVLTLELEQGSFDEASAKSLIIPTGYMSMHDDAIVHGSPANASDRWRIGLTVRYSGTNVKCDLSKAPSFKSYMCRGVDEYKHNPQGTVPTDKYGRLAPDQIITSTAELKK